MMDGKTVVITGATAGIGRAAAIELGRQGAEVVVIGRDPAKGAMVVDEIPGSRFFRTDLSELAQVRSLAATLLDAVPRIDVLVNNAGIAARRATLTAEGFDEMLAANYLGPFLLTHLLLDRLQASAPARIVIVGSEAHRMTGRFDPSDFEIMGQYSGWRAQLAYGRTKLLDILFAEELARRLDLGGVTVNSLCPGLVATDLVRDVPGADRVGALVAKTPAVRTPEQGARMTVHLASSPDVEGITGRFWSSTPGARFLPPVGARRNPAVARTVYERTCEMVGVPQLAPL
jgi:NAD(P)-dependent dehydrogenase (short-subunit alcohol dehydrogenase family)